METTSRTVTIARSLLTLTTTRSQTRLRVTTAPDLTTPIPPVLQVVVGGAVTSGRAIQGQVVTPDQATQGAGAIVEAPTLRRLINLNLL